MHLKPPYLQQLHQMLPRRRYCKALYIMAYHPTDSGVYSIAALLSEIECTKITLPVSQKALVHRSRLDSQRLVFLKAADHLNSRSTAVG